MNTSEAAKIMVNGGTCTLYKNEYYWSRGSFWSGLAGRPATRLGMLPDTNDWQIKKEPIKYSKYIWLDKDPKNDDVDFGLSRHIFGDTPSCWSPTKDNKCDKRYKITVEECPENE